MSAVPNLPESVKDQSNGAPKAAAALQRENGVQSERAAVNGHSPDFRMHDAVVENHRPIKVIVIGAGYSGIYCGIRIPERIKNCELVIYDKNAGVGGTWRVSIDVLATKIIR